MAVSPAAEPNTGGTAFRTCRQRRLVSGAAQPAPGERGWALQCLRMGSWLLGPRGDLWSPPTRDSPKSLTALLVMGILVLRMC